VSPNEKDTLFALQPDRFVIPGQSKNGNDERVPALEFEKDPKVPGLYRARIDRSALETNGADLEDKHLKTLNTP